MLFSICGLYKLRRVTEKAYFQMLVVAQSVFLVFIRKNEIMKSTMKKFNCTSMFILIINTDYEVRQNVNDMWQTYPSEGHSKKFKDIHAVFLVIFIDVHHIFDNRM